jgi:hypothetical protein
MRRTPLPVWKNLNRNPVILLGPFIRERSRARAQSFTSTFFGRYRPQGHRDAWAFGHAGHFVEFDCPVVHLALYRSGYACSSGLPSSAGGPTELVRPPNERRGLLPSIPGPIPGRCRY